MQTSAGQESEKLTTKVTKGTKVERLPGWEGRLYDYLKDAAGRPAKWGRNDCVLFACDAVEAMTGVDLVAEIRGQYGSRAGAMRQIARMQNAKGKRQKEEPAEGRQKVKGKRQNDGPGLEDAINKVAAEFGLVEIPVAFAQRGDLLIADRAAGVVGRRSSVVGQEAEPNPSSRASAEPTLGIVDFVGVHGLFAERKHAERVPVLKCRRAFAVGRRG